MIKKQLIKAVGIIIFGGLASGAIGAYAGLPTVKNKFHDMQDTVNLEEAKVKHKPELVVTSCYKDLDGDGSIDIIEEICSSNGYFKKGVDIIFGFYIPHDGSEINQVSVRIVNASGDMVYERAYLFRDEGGALVDISSDIKENGAYTAYLYSNKGTESINFNVFE